MEDELLLDWAELVHISSISVTSEITSIAAIVNELFARPQWSSDSESLN
jgi:hypothetical protein